MSVNVNITSRQKNKIQAVVKVNNYGATSNRGEIIIENVGVYLNFEVPYGEAFIGYILLENLGKNNNNTIYYSCKLSSEKLNMKNQQYICDDSQWRVLFKKEDIDASDPEIALFTFDLTVEVDTIELKNPFASLYDDTELTDFELRAVDGSVRFHSVVLATASPVLKGMLTGTWSESEKRTVQLQDTSKEMYVRMTAQSDRLTLKYH